MRASSRQKVPMRANDVRSTEAIRHGAYVCLSVPPEARRLVVDGAVTPLADRLGRRNEFEPGDQHPPDAVAFLRRVGPMRSSFP